MSEERIKKDVVDQLYWDKRVDALKYSGECFGHQGDPGIGESLIAMSTLLIVLFISILITRIATIVLAHAGLTRESAKIQARSAFIGAGFSTR